ncbi:hypothetical protein E0Z10_g1064 [Xylaria hypoxylon]|uniref:Phthiocerol/phthiodiolone dimycocerosyl transferase C-terminal domain-containing protein n=1 Tax=Xylaria hypoxylon TaxID=37992 RepID=A0A4Z0Z860_9PEZI|nr:hypothetical protein E0Z10_g1064 [Xylaria hypoxylon]
MATTTKKPIMLTMTSRLRSRSSLFLRRLFNSQHSTHDNKVDSTVWLPTIDEKKTPFIVSEKSTPLSQLAGSGTVSRPLGTLENFFKRLADAGASANREHAAFFTVLQVRFPSHIVNAEDYVARAWEVVGERFPALRAELSPPDEADPKKQPRVTIRPFDKHSFRSTFSVHPNCSNVDELFAAPSPIRGTSTCYWLPGPGQIVLRTSHWRADGFGQVLLTDLFMSTLADIVQRGVDAPLDNSLVQQTLDVPITPGLEDLIRKYVKDPPSEAAEADILMHTYTDGGKSIAIPTRPGSDGALAGPSARAAIRMSPESSAELTQACRTHGVSVTSALNAAIIRATARYPQDAEADSYVIFAPVDLRGPLIAAGSQECLQPVGVYVSGLPLRIGGVVEHLETGESVPGKSFDALADELSAFYSQDLMQYRRPGDTSGKTVSLLQIAEPYLERMTELFDGFPAPGCPYPKTPVISSLGKMDGLIKRDYTGDSKDGASGLRVTDFWVGIENMTPMITFHPWSWGDELTLSAAWNESFYSNEIAVDALEKIMKELGEGLKMDRGLISSSEW